MTPGSLALLGDSPLLLGGRVTKKFASLAMIKDDPGVTSFAWQLTFIARARVTKEISQHDPTLKVRSF